MSKICWLASYPKSGNTWVRILLSNYLSELEHPADINALEINAIASSRQLFDEYIGLSSSDMDEDVIKYYQPCLYDELVRNANHDIYMKVHDAYIVNQDGLPLFSATATKNIIYIIRNPLDVATSFAHHLNISLNNSIQHMCDESFTMAKSVDNINNQLPQLLLSWSGHVQSWIESGLKVHIVRYEDMIFDPKKSFKAILEFMNFDVNEERLEKAISFSSFDSLKKQEQEKGFMMKDPRSQSFFRKGQIGAYREELTQEQIDTIVEYHRETMIKYGYLNEHNQLVY